MNIKELFEKANCPLEGIASRNELTDTINVELDRMDICLRPCADDPESAYLTGLSIKVPCPDGPEGDARTFLIDLCSAVADYSPEALAAAWAADGVSGSVRSSCSAGYNGYVKNYKAIVPHFRAFKRDATKVVYRLVNLTQGENSMDNVCFDIDRIFDDAEEGITFETLFDFLYGNHGQRGKILINDADLNAICVGNDIEIERHQDLMDKKVMACGIGFDPYSADQYSPCEAGFINSVMIYVRLDVKRDEVMHDDGIDALYSEEAYAAAFEKAVPRLAACFVNHIIESNAADN